MSLLVLHGNACLEGRLEGSLSSELITLEGNPNRGCEAVGQNTSPTRSEAERGEPYITNRSLRSWRQRSTPDANFKFNHVTL
jgi:hypothetical protein